MRIAAALCALALTAMSASAHDYAIGPLKIMHPWARTTPNGAVVGAGFLKIKNDGAASDRLMGGTVEAASRLEIHETSADRGVTKMRELESGLEIRSGQTIELRPGGIHLMFKDLTRPLQNGERIKGTLTFEKAGKVEVEYLVQPVGAQEPAPPISHGEHSH